MALAKLLSVVQARHGESLTLGAAMVRGPVPVIWEGIARTSGAGLDAMERVRREFASDLTSLARGEFWLCPR